MERGAGKHEEGRPAASCRSCKRRKLFYLQGYESTSVDQILQALHLSKGGFYHHFESKEALLWAICEERASSCAQAIAKAVADCPGGASARINAMFDKNGLWRQDQTDFLGLLIRVGYRGGNLTLRERLKSRLYQLCLPIVDTIVADGVDSGEFLTPYPHGAGSLVLQLGLSFTDEIARLLAEEGPPDTARILEYLELYRYAVEQVLGAPLWLHRSVPDALYGRSVRPHLAEAPTLILQMARPHRAAQPQPIASLVKGRCQAQPDGGIPPLPALAYGLRALPVL